MNIKIKQIQAQETYKLRHQVMWPDKEKEFVMLENDEEGIHFGLFKNEKLISVVSLFMKQGNAQFRKFATKTAEQGQGFGTLLINHLLAFVLNKEVKKLWCNARVDKTSFYEKVGMKKTLKTFDKEGIHYVIMEKSFEY